MQVKRATVSPQWGDGPSPDEPVMLLLHGFGSHEHDLASLGPLLTDGPWASLRGPLELGYGAAAWFPLPTVDAMDTIDAASITQATQALWAWVDAHVPDSCPLTPVGFSQGGLMAVELLRSRPERIASTVVLGGLVSPHANDAQVAASRPRVFWGRGSEDRVITDLALSRTDHWLKAHTALTAVEYPGLAHSVNEQEIADVRAFLADPAGRRPRGT